MRFLILLCCLALAATAPSLHHPSTHAVFSPYPVSSQYHAQDTLGQYTYGYSAVSSAKAESKTLDGVVRGGYSYLDGNGVVQTANYIADDVNGFRVAATNLPKHVVYETPEVAAARAAHSVAYNKAAYAAALSPDVDEAVVVPAAVVGSYVASPQAVSVVGELPSTAFSYSSVPHSPSVAAVPSFTSYSVPVSPVSKDFSKTSSYATVETVPVAAVSSFTSYPVPVSPVSKDFSKTSSYATVETVPVAAVSSFTSYPVPVSPVSKDSSKTSSYATVETVPVAAVSSFTSYPVPVSEAVGVLKEVPSKAFSYSTVSTSPVVSPVSAPAAVSYSVAADNIPVVSVLDVKKVRTLPHPAVYSTTSHQYHVQDDLGQYSYGYSGGPSAKVETKTLDGVTRGRYSYVDGNGIVQSASYVADDINGFRVAATNIPVGPSSPVVHKVLVSPVVVDNQVVADTPAVVAAKSTPLLTHAPSKYSY